MDSLVDPESTARLIDAFLNSLDLKDYDVKEAAKEGRPLYDPKGLYKLYIYGYRNEIRSSRKLQRACVVNVVFHEFNRRLSGAVEWGFSSVDGSKFQANNSKNNNFTKISLTIESNGLIYILKSTFAS